MVQHGRSTRLGERYGRVASGVVSEAALADGVIQRTGQRGDATVHRHRAAASGELGADELVDVLVREAFEPDGAKGRQEIFAQVVAVAGDGGRRRMVLRR